MRLPHFYSKEICVKKLHSFLMFAFRLTKHKFYPQHRLYMDYLQNQLRKVPIRSKYLYLFFLDIIASQKHFSHHWNILNLDIYLGKIANQNSYCFAQQLNKPKNLCTE